MYKKRCIVLFLLFIFALPLLLATPVFADVTATWENKGTIDIGGTKYIDGKPDDPSRDYWKDGVTDDAKCAHPVIRGFVDGNKRATIHYLRNDPAFPAGGHCIEGTTDGVDLGASVASATKDAPASGSTGSTNEPSCEHNGGEMSWVLCPLLKYMDGGIKWLDEQINGLLVIPPSYYNTPELKETWGRLRNVALIVLVPMMLVMVISTALGFELVSAYTVKKSLPRFIIAAIFISLSWPIMLFAVETITIIGKGIGGLLTSSFGGLQSITLASLFNSNGVQDGGIAIVGMVGGLAALSVVTIGVLLSYAFIAVLGLFIAFVLLSLRQFVIVALMLLAPLAILAWIYPGNDKIWKVWKDSFIKLLLLYPMIMILISGGRIFAKIVHDASQGGFAASLIKLVAYVGPYFFIPTLFKLAGGVFATVSGMANDKGRGLFDRQKKFRQKKMGETFQKSKNYGRFSDRNKLSRGFNKVMGGGLNPKDAMRGRSGIRAGQQVGRTILGANAFENDQTFKANQNDDNFLLALGDEELANQKLAAAQTKFNEASATGDMVGMNSARAEIDARSKGINAAKRVSSRKSNATRLAAINQLAKTGYQLKSGEAGYEELSRMVDSVTGDDTGAYASAMDEAQFHLKNAGRYDLGGINHGAGYDAETGLGKVDPYTMASRAKPETIEAKGELMRQNVQAAQAALSRGDRATYNSEMEKAEIHHQELRTGWDAATGKNKDTFLKQLATVEAPQTGPATPVQSSLSSWANTATGPANKVNRRVNYVPGAPLPAGARAWDPDEVARGWRTEEVVAQQTNADIARSKARGARRPNPAELEEP